MSFVEKLRSSIARELETLGNPRTEEQKERYDLLTSVFSELLKPDLLSRRQAETIEYLLARGYAYVDPPRTKPNEPEFVRTFSHRKVIVRVSKNGPRFSLYPDEDLEITTGDVVFRPNVVILPYKSHKRFPIFLLLAFEHRADDREAYVKHIRSAGGSA